MKRTYESFEELANEMTKGEGILHFYNCVLHDKGFKDDTCIAWQLGVQSFAEWLDHIGVKIEITDDAEDFYEFMAKKAREIDERQAD